MTLYPENLFEIQEDMNPEDFQKLDNTAYCLKCGTRFETHNDDGSCIQDFEYDLSENC